MAVTGGRPMSRVVELLGGPAVLGAGGDLVAAIRAGLPYRGLESVLACLDPAAHDAVFDALRLRRGRHRLVPGESERVVRLARTLARAEAVLGDLDRAGRWLTAPNRALGLLTPLSRLDTELGGEEVEVLLARIA